MSNDLISREELKKAICKSHLSGNKEWLLMELNNIIDNAPTVEVGYLTNCANCERVEKIRAKRPKGEWIKDEEGIDRCSKCYHKCMEFVMGEPKDNFCIECGADMRGKEE